MTTTVPGPSGAGSFAPGSSAPLALRSLAAAEQATTVAVMSVASHPADVGLWGVLLQVCIALLPFYDLSVDLSLSLSLSVSVSVSLCLSVSVLSLIHI